MYKVIIDCKIRIKQECEVPLRKDIDVKQVMNSIIGETLKTEFDYVDVKDLVYREMEIK